MHCSVAATAARRRLRTDTPSGFMTTLPTELNRLIVMFAGLPCAATVNKAMHKIMLRLQLWLSSRYFFAVQVTRRELGNISVVLHHQGDAQARSFLRKMRRFRLTRCHYMVADDVNFDTLAPGYTDINNYLECHTLTFTADTALAQRAHPFLISQNYVCLAHMFVAKTVILNSCYVLVLDENNRWLACNRVPPIVAAGGVDNVDNVDESFNYSHNQARFFMTSNIQSFLAVLGWGDVDVDATDPMLIITYMNRSTDVESVRLVC